MSPAPTEASGANLEIVGWERRRGGSQSLDEGENAGSGDGVASLEFPRHREGYCLENVEGLIDKCFEPGCGLYDFVHETKNTRGHRIAFGAIRSVSEKDGVGMMLPFMKSGQ